MNDNIYKFRFRVFVLHRNLFVVETSRRVLKDVCNQVKCYRRRSAFAELLAAHTLCQAPLADDASEIALDRYFATKYIVTWRVMTWSEKAFSADVRTGSGAPRGFRLRELAFSLPLLPTSFSTPQLLASNPPFPSTYSPCPFYRPFPSYPRPHTPFFLTVCFLSI